MELLQTPKTLQAAIEFFSDEDRCHAYMVQMRWPDGKVVCPRCGAAEPHWLAKQRRFECKNKHSRRQFSVKVGTIFEDSPISLKSWLLAVWQITNCKNGISSYELARAIGVTQKTAWFMNHRIRLAMQDDRGGKMEGEIEVDETYIGGKARNMNRAQRKRHLAGGKGHKNAWAGKAAVMGLLERHSEKGTSRVRTLTIDSIRTYRLNQEVSKRVEDGATVYTDALASYKPLSLYYEHKVIDHAEKYVDGQIHTNGLENYWSLLKRAIRGTYVSVEPFHLFRYLDEQAFRFNERPGNDGDRFALTLGHVTGRRVTYDALIGASKGEARA
jgi:transposase-like protein